MGGLFVEGRRPRAYDYLDVVDEPFTTVSDLRVARGAVINLLIEGCRSMTAALDASKK
jgi:hypothetical protein